MNKFERKILESNLMSSKSMLSMDSLIILTKKVIDSTLNNRVKMQYIQLIQAYLAKPSQRTEEEGKKVIQITELIIKFYATG